MPLSPVCNRKSASARASPNRGAITQDYGCGDVNSLFIICSSKIRIFRRHTPAPTLDFPSVRFHATPMSLSLSLVVMWNLNVGLIYPCGLYERVIRVRLPAHARLCVGNSGIPGKFIVAAVLKPHSRAREREGERGRKVVKYFRLHVCLFVCASLNVCRSDAFLCGFTVIYRVPLNKKGSNRVFCLGPYRVIWNPFCLN